VLRRIMRRAMRMPTCSLQGSLMWRLVPALVQQMGTAYPSCRRAASDSEVRFEETISSRCSNAAALLRRRRAATPW